MPRKRSGLSVLVIAGLAVLGLVAVYFVTDFVLRGYAERRIRQEIQSSVPAAVSGDINVTIGGISVIQQYLSGNFERIDVEGPSLKVFDEPLSVHVVAQNVPVDRAKTLGAVHGTVDFTGNTLEALLPPSAMGAQLTFGGDSVTYTGSISVLGLPIDYQATATPSVTADSIILTPTSAELGTSVGSLDVGGIVRRILGEQPLRLCVAKYLPEGVELTGVQAQPGHAHLTFEATGLTLDGDSLSRRGSCSAA
ncbi:LmeA family phospholipid-binding protein [Cryobacterium tepidiphilum]|uniref:DUF2993 domain-containing protein n=1 Tax=Cryobacterium tepidiphilum TaxID=2486026 RepID=A0A3M8LDL7_9MICO|nr:DUF2993 domain-containing protein [Cryobacterium tepidiphilum]RNE63643.1 DUF2993 domain-containing protein [Cryobacterium tepidiphilum]